MATASDSTAETPIDWESEEPNNVEGATSERADVVIIQQADETAEQTYDLQVAVGGSHRITVPAERTYLDGRRHIPITSDVLGDAVGVTVTEGPDGARCANIHLDDDAKEVEA